MKVVTFGETMLRFTSPDLKTIIQSHQTDLSFAGSESNVAVDLKYWGLSSKFLSAVSDNSLGEKLLMDLQQYGVDTSSVVKTGNRLGLLFLEPGANQRGSRVIYDRKNSAFSEAKFTSDYFEEAFEDAIWFHWSGITAGLGVNAIENLRTALTVASQKGMTISCDLNYRSNLWDFGINPREIMPELVSYCNLLLGNEEDAVEMLGVSMEGLNVQSGELESAAYKSICKQIFNSNPRLNTIAFNLLYMSSWVSDSTISCYL